MLRLAPPALLLLLPGVVLLLLLARRLLRTTPSKAGAAAAAAAPNSSPPASASPLLCVFRARAPVMKEGCFSWCLSRLPGRAERAREPSARLVPRSPPQCRLLLLGVRSIIMVS
jgi:hypothetical protein